MKKGKKRFIKILKIVGKILGIILILLLLTILFVRSPWGQGIIVDKITAYVSGKTKTRVEVGKLFITFAGDIQLDDLYLEDKKGDTLIYSRHLEADLPLWPLIKGSGISLDQLEWSGVRAHVYRKDSVKGFNYQFLIDAFAEADTTTTKPVDTSSINLNLGTFNLSDIKLSYDDQVTGMDAKLDLGALDLHMDKTDLKNMDFKVGNAALKNSKASYTLTKTSAQKPSASATEVQDTSAASLPTLSIGDLKLDNVSAVYLSVPDSLTANVLINQFRLEMPRADLTNNMVNIHSLALNNSHFKIESQKTAQIAEKANTVKDSTVTAPPFEWPDFKVAVDKIDFFGNEIEYYVNGARPFENVFNADAIHIKDFGIQAQNIAYQKQKTNLDLRQFTFAEASGIHLKQFALNLTASDQNINLENLDFALNDNVLKGQLSIDYASVQELIDHPENASLSASIGEMRLNVGDAFRFQPDLAKNENLNILAKKPVTGNISASGKMAAINIPVLSLNWGTTHISANGRLANATDPVKLRYDFPKINITSTKGDLDQFMGGQNTGLDLPKTIHLTANVKGSTEDVDAIANIETDEGSIDADINAAFGNAIAFDGSVNVAELQLGKILKNSQLGALDLNINASGRGKDVNNLDATIDATVDSFGYNGYAIKDLKLNGDIKDGKGNLASAYKDENIDIDLKTYVELDSVATLAKVDLDLKGADLQALGLASRNVKAGLKLNGTYKGNADTYTIKSNITNAVAVYDNQAYLIGDVDMKAFVRPDSTSLDVTNRMLDLHLESNADPAAFSSALQRHIQTYLSDVPRTDTVTNPVKLSLRGRINNAPVLGNVLVANLKQLDTVKINVDFDEKIRKLTAAIDAPHINYNDNEIDSLAITVDSDPNDLNFQFGLNELTAGPLAIQKTIIDGQAANKKLNLEFSSFNKDTTLIHISSQIRRVDKDLQIALSPDSLILNREPWTINPDNKIILAEALTRFENFTMSRNSQQLTVRNDMPGVTQKHIGVEFNGFKLSTLLSYLNPEEDLADGDLNGTFIVENPSGKTGLLADLDINKFTLSGVDMGTLSLNAKSENGSSYDLNLGIKGGAADLDLTGSYAASPDAAKLDLNLALNKVEMKTLEAFSGGELKESSGNLTGNLKIVGTTVEPQYEGAITFTNAKVKITKLNADFLLAQETLKLDNKGLYFDNFSIQDVDNNKFIVNGNLGTKSFLNPTFDLSFKADNFQVLNSTAEDFDLVYGKANFDVDAKLTGDLNLPKLDMDLNVGENTDVTYVIPTSQVGVESRDGVVIFVDRKNPQNILNQTEEKSYTLSGFDINARLKVDQKAKFNIILDKETGDNFAIQGDADLDFTMNPNGRTTLSGAFEVKDGHYEMSLYNLVKRRFEIAEGSRVTWSGDPLDADMDVRAYYEVETTASPLMALATSGADIAQKQRFKQELEFLVYLNISGQLMQPKIDFNLDMPKEDQGAVGGQVYGRVQQLNQQENELNKQVFSLLVLNKFFPDSGSDGANGGIATVARDNINDAISDQLNAFSDKLLGKSGVSLDFGLDSYTDYQGANPEDRTTLNVAAQKKLLDDRLIVRVGSDVDLQGSNAASEGSNPVIGNVSLEYLLTEDGRFRLKGFRRNEFENVIDGQLIVSGISLIFTREFNKFDELWRSMFKATKNEEDEQTTHEK